MNYRVWGDIPGWSAASSIEIEAATAADAATEWAEKSDAIHDDPPIANGPPVTVYVRTFGDVQPRRFIVTAQQHYTYRAKIAPATKESK